MERLSDYLSSTANHIHVELDHLSIKTRREVGNQLGSLGFEPDNFLSEDEVLRLFGERLKARGHVESVLATGKPPAGHWTRKFDHPSSLAQRKEQRVEYGATRDIVAEMVTEFHTRYDTGGYMESEHVLRYCVPDIAKKPFEVSEPFPFTLVKRPSDDKHADLHLGFGEDVDPRLLERLVHGGLYVVLMPSDASEVRFILTAQGTISEIKALMTNILKYLVNAGGVGEHASAKIEIVDRIQRTSAEVMIHDVIESITWHQ